HLGFPREDGFPIVVAGLHVTTLCRLEPMLAGGGVRPVRYEIFGIRWQRVGSGVIGEICNHDHWILVLATLPHQDPLPSVEIHVDEAGVVHRQRPMRGAQMDHPPDVLEQVSAVRLVEAAEVHWIDLLTSLISYVAAGIE